jgi:hypothetical protein
MVSNIKTYKRELATDLMRSIGGEVPELTEEDMPELE